jgi:hypothetical protein
MFLVYLRAQDNLIIAMNVKCPKKMNRWAHLGRLLNFYKLYRYPLLEHTKDKRPDLMPSDQWWIIMYAVAPRDRRDQCHVGPVIGQVVVDRPSGNFRAELARHDHCHV